MNGDIRNRNPAFVPARMNAPSWTNPSNSRPPPNFSVPPPNMCNGNFPRFSGPMYNQQTFPMNRMNVPPPSFRGGNPRGGHCPQGPRFNQSGMGMGPKPSSEVGINSVQRQAGYVPDDIFGDTSDVPCGFPYFNPRQPPPMPNPINQQHQPQQSGGSRGSGRGFRGNRGGVCDRGRGGLHGMSQSGGLNRSGGPFHNNRGGFTNKSHDGSQQKKKPRVDKRELPENNVFYCDICDRGFKTKEKHQEHIDSHQKCGYKDCPFVAAPKLVQLHMSMQHRGGLAKKIWSVESEDDIKKWREERKKNYPTTDNVKKKKDKMEERISRGEVIETKDFSKMTKGRHGGRGNGRGRGRGRGRFRRGRGSGNDYDNIITIDDDDDDDAPPEEIKIVKSCAGDESVLEQNGKSDDDVIIVEDKGSSKSKPKDESQRKESSTLESENVKSGLSLLSGYGLSSSESDDSNDDEDDKDNKSVDNKDDEAKATTIVTAQSLSLCSDDSSVTEKSPTNLSTCLANEKTDLSAGAVVTTHKDTIEIDSAGDESDAKDYFGLINGEDKSLTDESEMNVLEETPVNILENHDEDLETVSLPLSSNQEREEKATSPVAENNIGHSGRPKGVKRGNENKDGPRDKRSKFTPKAPRKSYTLLEKLLSKEVRRERNKILQCVHFIVKNKFFDSTTHSNV